MNCVLRTIFGILSLMCVWMSAAAEKSGEYLVQRVDENTYVLSYVWDKDNRTNIGLVVGKQGLLLINTMMKNKVEALERAIRQISDKPVKYVINSNYDWYNTSANGYFAERGATIIAQKNVVYMTGGYHQLLFDERLSLDFGGQRILAYYSGGHSAGHVNVFLPKSNVMFVADSFSTKWQAPYGPGGLKGYVGGLKSILALANDKTRIVSGNVGKALFAGIADVRDEIERRQAFDSRVRGLFARGLSAEQMGRDKVVNSLLSHYEDYPKWNDEPWVYNPVDFYAMGGGGSDGKSMGEYAGQYRLDDGSIIEVFSKAHRLYAKAEGLFYVSLQMQGTDRFLFDPQSKTQYFEFVRDDSGKVSGIRVIFGQNDEHYLQRLSHMKIDRLKV